MKFEWDEFKNILNRKKHGITFEDAILIFNSDFTITYDSFHSSDQEDRYWAIGRNHLGVIIVVFTEVLDDVYRIISARKATRSEIVNYEKA
ncbi:BrnT family toxin [Bdellovibrio sp. HCB274]|uniref:BrnT family toxin n=1 Tax=Bdellovibrio sp. HCB274 TaxID=3394361 RepID=UPI0039B4DE30